LCVFSFVNIVYYILIMFDFQQKRQIKKVIYSRITIFVFLIIVIFLGKATYDIYTREQLSQSNYDSIKKEYDDLQSREAARTSEIARLNTGEGVEAEIRDRFSVAKPGEEVITVIDNDGTSTSQHVTNDGWWQKFTNLF